MFLINQAMVDVPIGTAALIVVLGMAVVFFGLILLMLVTKASGKIMQNKEAAAKAAAPAPAPAAAAPAAPAAKAFAPGSTTFPTVPLQCSWQSLPTRWESPSMSFASSPSARSSNSSAIPIHLSARRTSLFVRRAFLCPCV